MVIVQLAGGLANQMFPYAMGRRLAHHLGTELKLDISGYEDFVDHPNYKIAPRHFALDVFNIHAEIASKEEILRLTTCKQSAFEKLLWGLLHSKPKKPKSFIKERQYHFDPAILELGDNVYLTGNWNSPLYFKDIEDLVFSDFTLRAPPNGKNEQLLRQIDSVNAVSVHVRRGDYVLNPHTNQIHGVCGLDYYQRAIDHVGGNVSDPHFFVFSDDHEWVRENFRTAYPLTFVEHNGPDAGHEDMRLMSHCKHNIIANSGFSWWAAWLNKNRDKVIVAPKKWFATEKYDTKGLIPDRWLRL